MAKGFLFPGGIVSLPREAAERLCKADAGDAALLYLYLLVHQEADSLGWPLARLRAAHDTLLRYDLVDPATPLTTTPTTPPEPQSPPTYSTEDIALALKEPTPFLPLVDEIQRRLGKILSPADLRTLYTLYDYLALPAEVILLLTNWCIETTAQKYGPGRKPTLPQIKQEAFRWHRAGVDSFETAEEHLKQLGSRQDMASRILALLGITGRAPVDGERRYLDAWADYGFDDDVLRLAYEKTILKKQSMNWPYMNSILRSWYQQNLHTKAEIEVKEQSRYAKSASGTGSSVPQKQQDFDWLDQMYAEIQKTKEG